MSSKARIGRTAVPVPGTSLGRLLLVLAAVLLSGLTTPQAASAQTCLRAADLPAGAFEVTRAFTGRFTTTTQSDGSTLREPVFEPIPRGTTYNRPILNVGNNETTAYDQEPALARQRTRLPDGQLEGGTYYETWRADRAGCLIKGPVRFVPASQLFNSPTAAPTPTPPQTPGPTSAPSPAPTPTVTPAASPTDSPIAVAPLDECPDCGTWLFWLAVLAGLWATGVLENHLSKQYRGA